MFTAHGHLLVSVVNYLSIFTRRLHNVNKVTGINSISSVIVENCPQVEMTLLSRDEYYCHLRLRVRRLPGNRDYIGRLHNFHSVNL